MIRRLLLALALLLAPALASAQTGSLRALHPGPYFPTTERFVGVKCGALGGSATTVLSDGVDTGGTYRQQCCLGPKAVTSFKMATPGWYLDNSGEHPFPNAVTVNQSVEYPNGTLTTVTTGGLSSWAIAAGTEPISDTISVAMPAQACFYVKTHITVASGGQWSRGRFNQPGNGEGYVTGSDLTATTGAMSGAASDYMYGPTAIIGQSNQPGVCIIGDSISAGAADTGTSTGAVFNLLGFIEKGLSNHLAWHHDTRSANRLSYWYAAHALQDLLTLARCTSVIIEFGTNDLYGDTLSLSALETRFLNVANVWDARGVKVFATTMLPRPSASGDCSTLANQTPDPTDEPVRVAYNHWLLGLPALTSGRTVTTWDIAALAESSPDSGKWRVDLGLPANSTTDGGYCIHPLVAVTPTLATGILWWQLK